MRLPYLQLAMEVIELSAPDIAVLLDSDEASIGWGLVRLIRWAIARCPDNVPPSASDVVQGAAAARLIANAAGWKGDPEAFVTACCEVQFAILERVEGGVRVRGLDRYDAAWGKSRPDLWKVWKAQQPAPTPVPSRPGTGPEPARNRPDSGAEPIRNRAESGAEPALQMQMQMQRQEKKKQQPPAAAPPVEAAVEDERPSAAAKPSASARSEQAREVFAYWQERMGKPRAKLDKARLDRVLARLKDGYSVADLRRAVDGCRASAWHMGENPRGRPFNDLELICRDAKHVDDFAAGAPPHEEDSGPPPEETAEGSAWKSALERMQAYGATYACQQLQALRPVQLDHGVLLLEAPDTYRRAWVEDQYADLLTRALSPLAWRLSVPSAGQEVAHG